MLGWSTREIAEVAGIGKSQVSELSSNGEITKIGQQISDWLSQGKTVEEAATLRRHLTTSQRAMLAVDLEPMFAEEAEKRKLAQLKRGTVSPVRPTLGEREIPDQTRSDTKAGKVFGVGGTTVQKAKRVSKAKPQKVKDIIAGKTTVNAEYKKVNQEEKEKQAKAKLQFRMYLCRIETHCNQDIARRYLRRYMEIISI